MHSFTVFDPADGSGLVYAWHGSPAVDVYRHTEPELRTGERFLPGWPAEECETLQLEATLPEEPAARLAVVRAAVEAWHATEVASHA